MYVIHHQKKSLKKKEFSSLPSARDGADNKIQIPYQPPTQTLGCTYSG